MYNILNIENRKDETKLTSWNLHTNFIYQIASDLHIFLFYYCESFTYSKPKLLSDTVTITSAKFNMQDNVASGIVVYSPYEKHMAAHNFICNSLFKCWVKRLKYLLENYPPLIRDFSRTENKCLDSSNTDMTNNILQCKNTDYFYLWL